MAEPGFSTRPSIRRAALQVLPGGAPHRPAPAGTAAVDPVRVYVLGPDPLARAGIRALLDGRPALHVVGDGSGGDLVSARPDVVLCHGAVPAAPPAPGCPLLVVGGSGTALGGARGHLPATVTADQLAAAVVLAAAGYAVVPRPGEPLAAEPARPVSDADPATLTGRERQVLGMVARGLSNAEIAAALTLSEHTVKTHVQNLLGKLRLPNRLHAVIYAFETGLRTLR
ncbi:LuxR family transcriptional regulator [Streptomyces sp. ALI-76-A]|uniref:response regulator transcription factor n=1 Tax=Streptomyces sp. ALI-76-A TaxID=3025736 RepID=UPI00256F114D|nr:LuxR family transcriptional regulator [Streptomyces sp. ALI-76-A]MDL5205406.1 LuxR family transcriptional regulator [Streptomyces sp. ALI-76-A]